MPRKYAWRQVQAKKETEKEKKNRLARERYAANKGTRKTPSWAKVDDADEDPEMIFSPPTKNREKLADGSEGIWASLEYERSRRQDERINRQRESRLSVGHEVTVPWHPDIPPKPPRRRRSS